MKVKVGFSHDKTAYKHDIEQEYRKYSRNVSVDLSNDNVVICDRILGRSEEEYINGIMQPVIEEYNATQKRSDRKIKKPYCEYWKENKNLNKGSNKLIYEGVLSFGNHENIGKHFYSISRQLIEEKKKPIEEQNQETIRTLEKNKETFQEIFTVIFTRTVEEMERRYPHVKIDYAVIHFDEEEGTPHCHVGYHGEGEGYTKGLGKEISIAKALGNDGIERVEKRKEKDGFQLARFYEQVKYEILAKEIEKFAQKYQLELFIDYSKEPPKERTTKAQWEQIEQSKQEIREELQEVKKAHKELAKEKAEAFDLIRKGKEAEEVIEEASNLEQELTEKREELLSLQVKKEEASESVKIAQIELNNVEAEERLIKEKIEALRGTQELTRKVNEGALEGYEPSETKGIGKKKEILSYEVPKEDLKQLKQAAAQVETFKAREQALEEREKAIAEKEDKVEEDLEYASTKRSEALEIKRGLEVKSANLDEKINERASERIDRFLKSDKTGHLMSLWHSFLKEQRERIYQGHDLR